MSRITSPAWCWRGGTGIRDDPGVTDTVADGRPLAAHLPDLSGFRLSGRRLRLSAAIEELTLVVVVFEGEQRSRADAWLSRGTAELEGVAVLEVDVFDRSQLWRRAVIDGGMIDEIGDLAVLQRIITVYTDLDEFCAAVGITARSSVSALIVEPGGTIRTAVTGPADEDAWAEVRAALAR